MLTERPVLAFTANRLLARQDLQASAQNQEAHSSHSFWEPVAEVVPPSAVAKTEDWLGSKKDTMEILGDVIDPVIQETKSAESLPKALNTITSENLPFL